MNRFNELTMLDVGAGSDSRGSTSHESSTSHGSSASHESLASPRGSASAQGPFASRTARLNLDVHQHLWPERLLEALRGRDKPPRLRGWTLELAGEPPYEVDPRHHDPEARRIEAQQEGLDLALISPSSPLGIELLPPRESRELLDAYHHGALELPAPFGAWAGACLTDLDPRGLRRELDRGFVGLTLSASALCTEHGYVRLAPLLEVLEDAGRPLFIHPGPATAPEAAPNWWPTIVSYVEQMYEAWYAFRAFGRRRHPTLRVCFAMLAGLAPLHSERLLARAGLRTVVDENSFLEVSSYGTRAIDATVRVLGIDVLVGGSDRPYASPAFSDLGAAAVAAIRGANPLRLLDPDCKGGA
ncbi:MAG: amidohydrolase family protein [Solirubrobacteraceae bacterium]